MEERIIDFVSGLRAAGVRISVAESKDAFDAIICMGVLNQGDFRNLLRATLIKEAKDAPIFDQMFPLYFGNDAPPLLNLMEDLSPEEQELLKQALRALLEQLQQNQPGQQGQPQKGMGSPQSMLNNLLQLLQWLMQGQNPSDQQMNELGQQAGLPEANRPHHQRWMEQRMMRQMGMQMLEQLLKELAEKLAAMGMSQAAIDELMEGMQQNREALAEQIANHVGESIARQRAEEQQESRGETVDLMDRPFKYLNEDEEDLLREEVRRLAAQLRSRAALRRKRASTGTLDTKKTLRANLRYGGVPLELKYKNHRLKPKLLLVCDVSTSMRSVVSFLLRMIYDLQDQVGTAYTFAFISDLHNITQDFAEHTPDVALEIVLTRLRPGHYNTDLGNSLNTLMRDHASTVDHRTTVIFVGDGRNNYNNPRLDIMEQIQRRSKRVVWFNPEPPHQWGTGDSDMPAYLPFAAAVHRVSNMTELTQAVDKLFT